MISKKIAIPVGIITVLVLVVSLIKILTPKDMDPRSYGAFTRGLQYLKKGDYESAILAFKTVTERNPDSPEGYFNLGCSYDAAGLAYPAIKAYQRAAELNPRYSKAYFNLGSVHDVVGKRQEAVAYYRKTLELNPRNQEALFSLIKDYALLRKIEDARAHLDTARIWFGSSRNEKMIDELEELIDEEEQKELRKKYL